jgi:DnaJ-domain-containing protein 1
MDPLFERFERLMRSFFQEGGDRRDFGTDPYRRSGERDYIFSDHSGRGEYRDRDFREAWDELDDFLRGGGNPSGRETGRGYSRNAGRRSAFHRTGLPPAELRRDYLLFGVAFGAPFDEVRRAYKQLISSNHPDRFAKDAGESDRATIRSQDINEAFQRIKAWEETGKRE